MRNNKTRTKQKTYIDDCRCDERLKDTGERSTRLTHWVPRGTGTPQDKDKVNRRVLVNLQPW